MTYEEVREASLLAGGRARRPSWGSDYVQFESTARPSHARLLRGSSAEALTTVVLPDEDLLADDWETA